MTVKKILFLLVFVFAFQVLNAISIADQFREVGYVEICNNIYKTETFDSLYTLFDELIAFLRANPVWEKKLYSAKERFIRSKNKDDYSTDFIGFYNESERIGRNQISFYYSVHFHNFFCSLYPEIHQIPEIINFLKTCLEIQMPCSQIFREAATELGLETIFSSTEGNPPVLFKVIKYFPSYTPTKPHYDGTAFSLFLNSTDNQSLLLSPYHASLTIDQFYSPLRESSQEHNKSYILLIPGTLLAEFSIYPTPHIVVENGRTRYAAVAFAMRPRYVPHPFTFSPLPTLKDSGFKA